MRAYRLHDVTDLGQTQTLSEAARLALANAVVWDPSIDAASLIGRLAVRVDGGQIVRLGSRISNTKDFTFLPDNPGPWTTALVFDGVDRGKVLFLPLDGLRQWKLVRPEAMRPLYVLMPLPGKWNTLVSTESFAQHVENSYIASGNALDYAEKGDRVETPNALASARKERDTATAHLGILLSLGTFTAQDAAVAQKGILASLFEILKEVEAAAGGGNKELILQTRERLDQSAEQAANLFDRMAEMLVARGLIIYALSKRYVETKNALQPRLPAILRPSSQAVARQVADGVVTMNIQFKEAGIDPDEILASLGGSLGDLGQAKAIYQILKRAAGKTWGLTKRVAARVKMTPASIGRVLKHNGSVFWTGIVFGLSNVVFERIFHVLFSAPAPGREALIEQWKESYRLQQQAQKELAEEQKQVVEADFGSDSAFGQGINRIQGNDPAIDSKLLDAMERLKDSGVSLEPESAEGPGAGTVILVGAAAVGIGYLLYRKAKSKAV